jgi:hypothetical protein
MCTIYVLKKGQGEWDPLFLCPRKHLSPTTCKFTILKSLHIIGVAESCRGASEEPVHSCCRHYAAVVRKMLVNSTRPTSSCRAPQMRRSTAPLCCCLSPRPVPETSWDSSVSHHRPKESRPRNTLSSWTCATRTEASVLHPVIVDQPTKRHELTASVCDHHKELRPRGWRAREAPPPAIVAIVVGEKGEPDRSEHSTGPRQRQRLRPSQRTSATRVAG